MGLSVWCQSYNRVTWLEGFFLAVLPCKSLSRSSISCRIISAVRIPSKALKHFNWQYGQVRMVYRIVFVFPTLTIAVHRIQITLPHTVHLRCGKLCSVMDWLDYILNSQYFFLATDQQMICNENKGVITKLLNVFVIKSVCWMYELVSV